MIRRRRTCAGIGALALTVSLVAAMPLAAQAQEVNDPAEFVQQRIALGGDGIFPNYRIPAIIQLNNGDLLASYDGRPTGTDSPGPNSILQRRSTDGGLTWGEQTVVAAGQVEEPRLGYSDPSYVYDAQTDTLFNFHVFSKDTGFWNSVEGDDDADRQVMSASVSVSTDGGHTWTKRSVTEVVKPAGVRATFASSGHGIQITRGEHAGRLVLQYAGAMTDGTVQSYSVYSDDHGETWTMGRPVGTNMDENKVVELSDGTLMLNSRMHSGGTWRYVSLSTDGGATWSEPQIDHTLADPRNNASIIAMNPGAEAGSAEAKELLFSNANSTAGRQNGSVRYSCDDGATWPVVRIFEPGATSYSDLVALQDGTFGILYEGAGNELRYGTFGEEWLQPFCAGFTTATATIGAGQDGELSFTVTNDDDAPLPAGVATAQLPAGWSAGEVEVPALAPGDSVEVTVPVTAAGNAALGVVRGDVVITAGDVRVRGDAEITVDQAAPAFLGATVTSAPAELRDVSVEPYEAGEVVPISFRVTGTANIVQTVTPLAGNVAPFVPPGAGNCRWRNLPVSGAYTCATPRYTITEEDEANGFAQVVTRWELSAEGMESVEFDHDGEEIDLRERAPELSVTRAVTGAEGALRAGDVVTSTITATNTGNVRLTGLDGAVTAAELGIGEELQMTVDHVITEADLAAGELVLPALEVGGANGALEVSGRVPAEVIEVHGADEPGEEPVADALVLLADQNGARMEAEFHVPAGAEVFVGDWDGDGIDTLAWRDGNLFTFTSANADGGGELSTLWYGLPTDEVLVGDWDGDGIDTIAVRRGNVFHVRNDFAGGNAQQTFAYGRASDDVIVGDFDGDGVDTPWLRRGNAFHLKDSLSGGTADLIVYYGKPGETVLVGDVNGDGVDDLVVQRGSEFHLRTSLTTGNANRVAVLGIPGDQGLVGDWNGDGIDGIGVLQR